VQTAGHGTGAVLFYILALRRQKTYTACMRGIHNESPGIKTEYILTNGAIK
jgi:hypothetical protein